MIAFKLSLNFDLAKEMLKIQCQIYILIKKVIIPWKIQAEMKAFTPPFFNYFSFSLNRKKRVMMRKKLQKPSFTGILQNRRF